VREIAVIATRPATASTVSASRSLTSITRNRSRSRRPSHRTTVASASRSTSRNHRRLGSNGHANRADGPPTGVHPLPGTPSGRRIATPTSINTSPVRVRMISPTSMDWTTAHHAFR